MTKTLFDQGWRFFLGTPDWPRHQEPDDSNWRLIDLPHDWSVELPRKADNPSAASGGFFEGGRGWYRKNIEVPEDWRGKDVRLEFEGVYMNAEVWLNEHYLGRHPYGYTSFILELTAALRFGQTNVLKVRVDNSHQMNSRWYSGSGIYRHVWLLVDEPVHIGDWGIYVTTPEVSAQQASVRIQTRVENESGESAGVKLVSKVYAPGGELVGESESVSELAPGNDQEFFHNLHVSAPKLWSPDAPMLYRLESQLFQGERLTDRQFTAFGIRKIEFSADHGFLLNGQVVKMKGGCVHHDNGILGAASFDDAEERKVAIHKASGYNAIRCAHNPPAPAFLDACDRLGMLVIDEAFDCWREGKNVGDYHVAFDDWWQRDIDSMVLRDRNHPSIVLWSIGNEILERDGRGGGAKIARRLAGRVRSLDPTRPVTAAINGVRPGVTTWDDTAPVFAALDVGGYNYQLKNYLPDHEKHPKRMMIGTESLPKEAFEHWNSVEESSYVLGDFVWTSLDYLGESGIGRVHYDGDKGTQLGLFPWHQANCGDLDLLGFKRPQSHYRDILWQCGSPLYIAVQPPAPEGKTATITRWGWPDVQASWNWAGREGQAMDVEVYSACEEVELFLSGASLGRKAAGKAERRTALYSVPYAAGELKAVGYQQGKAVAETVLQTVGAAAAIRLTPEKAQLKANGQALAYVWVEIVDAAGSVHPAADRPVYFTVSGAGSLAAVGNADPVSHEAYRGNVRSTFRGRCLVVVKASGQAGEIQLRAQADGINPAELSLKVALDLS